MKRMVFAIFVVFLAIAFLAPPAGAWMRDNKDYEWYGEHKFEHKLTIPSGTTVTDASTKAVSGTITDTSTTTGTGTYDYSGATSFDIGQSYDISLSNFWVGTTFALLTASASTSTAYLGMDSSGYRPSITWASGSSASIVTSEMRIKPWMTSSGMALRAHFTYTGSVCTKTMGWKLNINTATGTTSTPIAQTAVSIPLTTTSSQYVATLTPNASAIAALASGSWFTLEFYPTANQSGTAGVTYLTGVEYYKP